MNPVASEWIVKAEEDFDAAVRLSRVRIRPLSGVVCFHAQQCAEKYLKACLQEDKLPVPKTHNLATLLDLLVAKLPLLSSMRAALNLLSGFAVEFRYPGETATVTDARKALSMVKSIRQELRAHLGLSTGRSAVARRRPKKE